MLFTGEWEKEGLALAAGSYRHTTFAAARIACNARGLSVCRAAASVHHPNARGC